MSFFLIENEMPHTRLESSFGEILDLYKELSEEAKDVNTVFTTTDRGRPIFDRLGLGRHFDQHHQVTTADDMVDAVSSSDFIVTERLHPAIIAACYGIPFTY